MEDSNNVSKIDENKTDISNDGEAKSLTVEEKIDNLLNVSDSVWMHYGLLFSTYYDKLSESDINEIKDNVSNLALDVANKLKEEYSDLDSMFSSFKLERCVEDEKEDSWGREVFGYFVAPNKIYTVKRTIRKLCKYIHSLSDKYKEIFNEGEIHNVILSHEFFHFYEEKNKKTIYTKNYRVKVFKLLGFTYKSRMQAISEIAAMEFARNYTGCKFNPYILNFVLLCNGHKDQADSIYETVMELALKEG